MVEEIRRAAGGICGMVTEARVVVGKVVSAA